MPLTPSESAALMADLTAVVAKYMAKSSTPTPQRQSGTSSQKVEHDELPAATDADLDGKHGDPTVKFMPKSWTGENLVGRRFSACPAPFLAMLAHALAWSAERNEREGKAQFAKYDRLDAARAQGWRRRLEAAADDVPMFGPPPDEEF